MSAEGQPQLKTFSLADFNARTEQRAPPDQFRLSQWWHYYAQVVCNNHVRLTGSNEKNMGKKSAIGRSCGFSPFFVDAKADYFVDN